MTGNMLCNVEGLFDLHLLELLNMNPWKLVLFHLTQLGEIFSGSKNFKLSVCRSVEYNFK